jgi:hypothetical protein
MIEYKIIQPQDFPSVTKGLARIKLYSSLGLAKKFFPNYVPSQGPDCLQIYELVIAYDSDVAIGWAIKCYYDLCPESIWAYVRCKYRRQKIGTTMVGVLKPSRYPYVCRVTKWQAKFWNSCLAA